MFTAAACATPRQSPVLGKFPDIQFPEPYTANGIHIAVTGTYQYGLTVVGLRGTATNLTGRDLKMCAVYFDIVDGTGAKVCDAIAMTQHLNTGQRWEFQATFSTPFSTQFKAVQPGAVRVL